MADSQSIIALNIGSQRVTMGVLSPSSNGGLILKKYASTTILADPAAEMTKLPQIKIAISELTEKLGVQKQKVAYAISGQSVFARFVKLPVLENDDLEQLVTFEAQQHVPFPINEVVWDWQLLSAVGAEQEVVLVAIKSDALDEINDCVTDTGLHTKMIDSSPMASANAFLYNYDDLEESALLIDIGARSTNLIYKDGTKIFTRTIAIGGATITSAISKEYNVPFIEAESQKCSNGMVALDTRHTSGLDELTAALASCIRTALNRMPAEIARTTNFFRSQHGGEAPARVILAGGGSNLPKISDFFQEKLRLPVEYFNPLRKISVGKGVDVDQVSGEAHLLGEIVGLGLRSIDKAKLQIDLVPDVVREERADAKRKPLLIAAAAILIGSCAAYAVTGYMAKKKALADASDNKDVASGLAVYADPINSEQKKAEKIGEIVDLYGEAVESKMAWNELLNELNANFAHKNLWVTSMEPLINYDPDAEENFSGISNDFSRATSDKSSVVKVGIEEEFLSNGRPNRNYKAPMVNALRLKGYRRGDSTNDVIIRHANLLDKSELFTDKIMKGKKEIEIPDNALILENETSIAEGKLAAPFTVIVPLANPIPFK